MERRSESTLPPHDRRIRQGVVRVHFEKERDGNGMWRSGLVQGVIGQVRMDEGWYHTRAIEEQGVGFRGG